MNADRRGCLTKAEDEAVLQLYNYTVYTEYDRSSCLLECRARYIYQRCGCLPYYYPDFGRIWKKPTTCTAEGLQCLGNNTRRGNKSRTTRANLYETLFYGRGHERAFL